MSPATLVVELEPGLRDLSAERFRNIARRQCALMHLDGDAAIATLPILLTHTELAAIRSAAKVLELTEGLGSPRSEQEHANLERMLTVFEAAARR